MLDIRKEKGPNFYGMYRALVVNNGFNSDTSKPTDDQGRGRIQVRVLGVHSFNNADDPKDGIPNDNLPWAEPAGSLFGSYYMEDGKKKAAGMFSIPPDNSWVWIFFDNGDHNRPVYFAAIPGNDEVANQLSNTISSITTKQGHRIVFVDDKDDPTKNEIRIFHANDDAMIIMGDKEVSIAATTVNISATNIQTGSTGYYVVLSVDPGPIKVPGGHVLVTSTNLKN